MVWEALRVEPQQSQPLLAKLGKAQVKRQQSLRRSAAMRLCLTAALLAQAYAEVFHPPMRDCADPHPAYTARIATQELPCCL